MGFVVVAAAAMMVVFVFRRCEKMPMLGLVMTVVISTTAAPSAASAMVREQKINGVASAFIDERTRE